MTRGRSGRGAARRPRRRRGDRRNAPREARGGVAITLVLALVSIFWISPLALLVITAVRPLSDFIGNGPLSWPQAFTLSNFTDAWRIGNFATTYRNSVILPCSRCRLGVLISAMLAYALASSGSGSAGRSCSRSSSV